MCPAHHLHEESGADRGAHEASNFNFERIPFGDVMCISVHMFSPDLHPECLCGTVKGRVDVFKVSRALVDKQEGVVRHWGC